MIRPAWDRLATAPPLAAAAGLAVVHLVAAGFAFDPTPHTGGDNAAYLALARSLLEHGRYLELWDPAAGPHTQYPPGFPALLAGAMALGITSWTALKTIVLLTSALAVGLSYRWMRARSEPGVALGTGLLVALAPGVIGASHWILSDVPFWAAVMATLWFAARDRPGPAAGAAFAALLLRTAGIPVVVAVAAWLALRRRWRWAAGTVALLALAGAAWLLRTAGSDVPYASNLWLADPYAPDRGSLGLAGLLGRVAANAEGYGFGHFMRAATGNGGLLADALAGGILGLAAVGWWRGVRRGAGVAEILLPLYLGMLLVWPTAWAGERLLLPVLPVLLLLAAEGAGALPRRSGSALRVAGLALLVGISLPPMYAQWRLGARCRAAAAEFPSACLHPDVRPFFSLADWTAGRLPPGAAVLSRKPTLFFHFSGVPGRTYPFTLRAGALFEEAERAGARYVVLDHLGLSSTTYLTPVLARHPERFCIVQASRVDGHDASLLGILPPDAPVVVPGQDAGDGVLDLTVCPPDYFR